MFDIYTVILILLAHFIADFVCQTDKIAVNKSSNLGYLSLHAFMYSSLFLFWGFQFLLITFAAHWIVDFFSSKATTKLWKEGKRHWFFVVIGLDQFIHVSGLFITYYFLI